MAVVAVVVVVVVVAVVRVMRGNGVVAGMGKRWLMVVFGELL